MNIQSLKLTGFTGIKKGMGLDSIAIDFTGRDGLISIAGPTGNGKTTILENLQPYPMLVSRPESALKNHVWSREASRELSFIHNGKLIETLIKVDAQSGRSEGFIVIDGAPQVNGKISDYKKAIEEMFGSPTLFFNSVFCAQNSTKISGMRPGDLKALFAEFLGPRLTRLSDQEDMAKTAIRTINGHLATVDGSIWIQQDRIERAGNIEAAIDLKEKAISTAAELVDQYLKEIAAGRDQLQILADLLTRSQSASAVVKNLTRERDTIHQEIDAIQREMGIELDTLRGKVWVNRTEIKRLEPVAALFGEAVKAADAQAEAEASVTRMDERLVELDAETETAEKALDQIKARVADERAAADELLRQMRDDCRGCETELETAGRTKKELTHKLHALDVDPDLRSHDNEVKRLTAAIAGAARVECPECGHHFAVGTRDLEVALIDATAARNNRAAGLAIDRTLIGTEIKDVDAAILTLAQQRDEVCGEFRRLEADAAAARAEQDPRVTDAINALDHARGNRDQIRMARVAESQQITQYRELSRRLPEIEAARDKIDSLHTDIEALTDKGVEAKRGFELRIEGKKQAAASLSDQIMAESADIDPAIPGRIETVKGQVARAEALLSDQTSSLSNARATLATLQTNFVDVVDARAKLARLNRKRSGIINELTEWEYLKHAVGANGLRALEIDAVAPAITHDANQLLEAAFGSWAMVDFRTQDDEGREVLEPRVIDQDGDSVLVANRSGGQQVWAMKALRLAMTKISKEKSGRDLQTAYADEDDAGLDVETATSFTKLYKAFMDYGHFSKCFMISHKPECVSLADHVLRLNGGVRWEL